MVSPPAWEVNGAKRANWQVLQLSSNAFCLPYAKHQPLEAYITELRGSWVAPTSIPKDDGFRGMHNSIWVFPRVRVGQFMSR